VVSTPSRFGPRGERARFSHGETFSGLLVGPFARWGMLDATRQGFHAMNIALKERAENQTT
jgi:hypothetical protein